MTPTLLCVKAGRMDLDLYTTEPRRLDDFIKQNLEPNEFNIEVRNAVHRICDFLKNRCFIKQPGIKVIRAVKGGSSGKGTALRNGSDADLVVFLNCFQSFEEQRNTRQDILEGIQQVLTECASSIANKINDINITFVPNSNVPPKSLNFALKSKKKNSNSVEFDILPAFDALDELKNGNTAHLKLMKFVSENGDPCGEFSACFTELQKNFVKQRDAKLKDLIRLLKYWYKECVKPRKSELAPGQRLPAKYAVELLTIYAWEQGNGTKRFDTAEGFRTVLELICNYQNLHIYWTNYYNVDNQDIVNFLRKKLRGHRPIILDPADPTNNVASSDGWYVMVKEAMKCLSFPCVSGVQAWSIQPVAQFEITVISLNGSSLPLMANIDTNILMIKNQIQQNWSIPVHQQRLMFNETILNGGKLLDSGIFFDAKLHLLVTNSMEIFVRHPNGRNLEINVSPTDKVLSLKNKIQNLERISPSQYYLTFQSQTLEDSHTLEYYGIDQHCTIDINLRLRGAVLSRGWSRRETAGKLKPSGVEVGRMDLYRIEPSQLDDFIQKNLKPIKFFEDVKNAVRRISYLLRNQCFRNQPEVEVIRAVKGGSSGKGTALRNGSDADLVVFLSCFQSFQEQRNTRQEILQEIQDILERCASSIAFKISDISISFTKNSNIPPKSLSFAVKSKKNSRSVNFDVLPVFDVLKGSNDANEAHLKLMEFVSEHGDPCGEFSACFTELQRKFVKQRDEKLKDLIRLLKYWYNEYVKPRKSELAPGQRLPAKYAVELLTIYAWEQGNWTERFVTAEGFQTVLDLICNYQNLHIYWTNYYNVDNPVIADFLCKKLCGPRPIILDPADPTNNVASSAGWHVMVKEAVKWLHSQCVYGIRASEVQPVAQFKITVISLNGSSLPLMANIDTNISMIKNQIQQNWSIPVHQQHLMFNETILNGGKTLLDSGIFFDAKLHLLVTTSMEIFVRHPNGRNLEINVSPTDKVLSLKNKIQNLERISPSQYYLTFQSRTLEDSHTLEYYGIDQHCTIDINLRLRGGKTSAEYIIFMTCAFLMGLERLERMDLYETIPKHLDTFIFRELRPDQQFQNQVAVAIDRICSFLKERCFYGYRSIKIIKTVKGGSSGKGTTLKNRSDADLVVFISQFKNFQDQKKNRGKILKIIWKVLNEIWEEIAFDINMTEPRMITLPSGLTSSPRSLSFSFQSTEVSDSVEVDVLPAFDALGQHAQTRPNAQVYVNLIKAEGLGGEFSTCFTELQRDFVKCRPVKLKDLIRLVKHWYIEYVRPYKCQLRGEFLPPKYALELLVIYAWESVGGGDQFSTAEGFRTVMELIVRYRELWIFWTTNYDFDNCYVANFLKDKLQEQRPMILDPADPTGNVAGNARWDLVAKEAKNCLEQVCAWNVEPWKVEPVKDIPISVKLENTSYHTEHFSMNPFLPIRYIKAKSKYLTSTPMSSCYLEWNDQILNEDQTLSDYGIFYSVTILLKEQTSWCSLM
ncbi:uncharacterized protein LOC132827453 [Hemiscyllium ocellatum]|uniref:uncharacterized protein LOC132827453 n=1 Tax=Hemiscyllium ocellatum TaxID=170820 RepID=UPI0029668733|nr:uncharacterized protein LOC132827453 [Hemiscyllium ocellatum]